MTRIFPSLFAICLIFFTLSSSTISAQNLYSDSISVKFFLLDECKICQFYGPEFNRFETEFPSFHFIGYFPNFSSKKDKISAFGESHQIDFPLKTDYFKTQSLKFEVEILPTVVVYDERNQKILYKGRIDDRFYSVGKQRKHCQAHDLQNALQAIEKNISIEQPSTQAVGCFINFTDNISSKINKQ